MLIKYYITKLISIITKVGKVRINKIQIYKNLFFNFESYVFKDKTFAQGDGSKGIR